MKDTSLWEKIYAFSNKNVIGNNSAQIEEPTLRGIETVGKEWERHERADATRSGGLVPAGLSQKSLHKPCLGFEGDYSFKMRVIFLGGLGAGRRAGDGYRQARTALETKEATESTTGDIKKLKNTLGKSITCCSPVLRRGAEDCKRLPKSAAEERPKSDLKD